jgi:hypothetical protein
MSFAIWTGIAIVAVSTICFKLMQRAEARRGAVARNSNGDSGLSVSGSDWSWGFFSPDHGQGSSGDNCSSSDSFSSGSCDSGGGGDGGAGGSGD